MGSGDNSESFCNFYSKMALTGKFMFVLLFVTTYTVFNAQSAAESYD